MNFAILHQDRWRGVVRAVNWVLCATPVWPNKILVAINSVAAASTYY
jgi:hypothetical protein